MMKPHIFVTRKLPGRVLDSLISECTIDTWEEEDVPPPHPILIERARNADGLLCLLTDTIDKAVLDAAKKLVVISNYAVGFDNIDLVSATSRRIPVGNTPDVLTETTADCAFALLMSAARRIVEGVDYARLGNWRSWCPTLLLGCDVYGATLGIVGMGRIGRAMARRARGFDMKVVFHKPSCPVGEEIEGARSVTFEEVISASDFLSLHVPLTNDTCRLIDRAVFSQMKSTATLINTSRGAVVDHAALRDALEEGQIGYAALDVTDPEPLPSDHALYNLKNCLIVPHLGSASIATRTKMAEMAAGNLVAGLRGERLPHCVNPKVYDG
ncbi:MAG: D-glycerate dehydrogenase [Deltaproteobacteria bacterium]|nr:D-glycerate dehydrogenase [Deltaproteobacteria bacterium]